MHQARIGIDVGGTFTDLVLLDPASGETHFHKLASTPNTPHQAPLEGITRLLDRARVKAADVAFVGLGTTVATNTLLQRAGGPTGLITTAGFRDLLEIGRQTRPVVFDPFIAKPQPLVPREHRIGVRERISFEGQVLTPLDEDDVLHAVELLRKADVASVAICLLHAYVNPAHERLVAALVRAAWPSVHVVTSEGLVPEFREYERLTTTVLNAYLMPGMSDYLAQFSRAVRDLGIPVEPLIMSSSGGAMRTLLAARRPVDTLFSGPSGGVSGAAFVAAAAGVRNTINLDMGGTSTEVCVVHDGTPALSYQRDIEGFTVKTSSIAVNTIGAGGSSIAWIDAGGLLHVGPNSVGADPGPACYDRGGTQPTVTDANVVLGRLNPDHLLGGMLRIDAGRAAAAIEQHIARPKGLDVEAAAAAILAVSSHNIAQAIRVVSTRQGLDPNGYVLVAYGGAGPLHAASVAAELGIHDILVPPGPGLLCALGVLTKDIAIELSMSRLMRDGRDGFVPDLRATLERLQERARAELTETQEAPRDLTFTHSVDARYVGQNFELPVLVDPASTAPREQIRARFHEAHRRAYGFARETSEVELVTFRVRAVLATERPRPVQDIPHSTMRANATTSKRRVLFEAPDCAPFSAVVERSTLAPGDRVQGPAIIEQMDTTTIVPPAFVATVDATGNLCLLRQGVA